MYTTLLTRTGFIHEKLTGAPPMPTAGTMTALPGAVRLMMVPSRSKSPG